VSHQRIRNIGGRIACVAALATALVAGSPTASALAGTAAVDWSASHQSGSATGTSSTSYSGLFKTVSVTGTLTSASTDCYRLQLVVQRDLAVQFIDVAEQCGTGSTPATAGSSGMTVTTSFSVRVCRVVSGSVTGCGATVPV